MSPTLSFRNADSSIQFENRHEAGEKLAQTVLSEIGEATGASRRVVYALPRGGLAVASPVARLLKCPLDIVVAKKITQPNNRELAIGAVTSDGCVVWMNQRRPDSGRPLDQYSTALQEAQEHAQAQLIELAPLHRFSPQGAIAILVDDGIATGMTMAAAVRAIYAQHPEQVWICAPVAPLDLMPFLQGLCDRAIVLETPRNFYSVSRFYREFPQVETREASLYLQQQNN